MNGENIGSKRMNRVRSVGDMVLIWPASLKIPGCVDACRIFDSGYVMTLFCIFYPIKIQHNMDAIDLWGNILF